MKNNELSEVTEHLIAMQIFYMGDLNTFKKRYEENRKLKVTSSTTITETTVETTRAPGYDYQSNSTEIYEEYINNQKYFLLTIPITLATFSIIDFVGNLKKELGKPVEEGTNENFEKFFGGSHGIDRNKVKGLNWLFRQGVSHLYFPKHGLEIGYDCNNPEGKLFFKQKGHHVLNVNFLISVVTEILDKCIKDSIGNETIQSRYKEIMDASEDDFIKNESKLI